MIEASKRLSGGLSRREEVAFWGIALLKLTVAGLGHSRFSDELFIPFVDYFVRSGFANPWEFFLSHRPDAFPYSSGMLAILSIPYGLALPFLREGGVGPLHLIAFKVPLLLADFAIWRVLAGWFPTRLRRVFWLYWCCPIVFYVSYVHGQIDAVPTALLCISMALLIRNRPGVSGLFYGVAVGSKFHVLAVLPFFLLYIVKRPERLGSVGPLLARFLSGVFTTSVLLIAPLLTSSAYRQMVFGAGESRAVFAFSLSVAPFLHFYFCPAVLLALLVKFASYSKTNRDIFILYCGLVFACLVLLLPPSPGWYFWSVPFIVYFFIQQVGVNSWSFWGLAAAYLAYNCCRDAIGVSGYSEFSLSLLFTVLQSVLTCVIFWIYRAGVRSNAVYKPNRKPLFIGIGGDSSTGKHTLARGLVSLFGERNVLQVNGDDYHRWPRGHDGWTRMTHLNPQGNDLHLPVSHVQKLRLGQTVAKSEYDHRTGRFTESVAVEPRRINLFVGLHPFYLPKMRSMLDLKIFMETTEELRVARKVARDSRERSYSVEQVQEQIEKRKPDGARFIEPQRSFADLVVKYVELKTDRVRDPLEGGVCYTLSNDIDLGPLVGRVPNVGQNRVHWEYLPDLQRQELYFEGTIAASEVGRVAYESIPSLEEITGGKPVWESDSKGMNQLMTLVVLSHLFETKSTAGSL